MNNDIEYFGRDLEAMSFAVNYHRWIIDEIRSFIKSPIIEGRTGTKISSADELSASSGLLFSPIMWFKQKEGLYESFNKLSSILNYYSNDTLFLNVMDGSSQFVINNLLTNGYIWKEKKIDFTSDVQRLTFTKDNATLIVLNCFSVNKNNFEEFLRSFENVKKNSYYFIFIWDWQNYMIN